MDNTKEPVKKLKRPKSATRYPKRTNTYVVAFALQEPSVENIPKTIAESKRIPANCKTSNESISVTGSATFTETLSISSTNDLSHPLMVPTISEVNIDMLDGNQCGDTEKKSPQTNNYQEVDNKMVDEQPQIIFNASKNIKRCKEHRQSLRKKPKSYRRVIKFKSIHFKYKNSKNVITRILEKKILKAKMNTINSEPVNTKSKVISRSRILKSLLAKENLLAGTDPMWMLDMPSLNENRTLSPNTETLCTPSVLSSYGSQNTLVNDSSFSFQSDDLYSIKTVNSVVPISSDTTPYNTDLNIAVAVGFTSLKPNNGQSESTINSNEKSSDKGNVTSTDTMPLSGMELTSQVPSDDSANKTFTEDLILNEKYMSSETLAGLEKISSNIVSDDDTFVMGRTISDFDKSGNCSESELTSISETRPKSEYVAAKEIINHVSQKVTLLDTVVHLGLGLYPEMTPSTSSGANFDNSMDDVLCQVNKDSLTIQNQLSKNVLKKSFEIETKEIHNNISLPNEVAIKAILKDAEKSQKKTHEELKDKNLPLDMIEIWNRLSLVLDLAIKRLEETITENIIREIKKSLSSIATKNTDETDESLFKSKGIKTCDVIMSNKEVFANEENLRNENHQGHQCDLVQNHIIDQLMLKLSVEGPKTLNSSQISLKSLKKPQVIRDYFDIIKQPTDECDVEVDESVCERWGKHRIDHQMLHIICDIIKLALLKKKKTLHYRHHDDWMISTTDVAA
ncbi:unnamed protein product [Arctia plantaginis]|uniref:Uncharacterized protein n=1 Tax=Arctia plantaginis TaxID=874455 RepID=A0A8S1B972_ARCPL|nr:unnamed protein product [Arctia plantaginis]